MLHNILMHYCPVEKGHKEGDGQGKTLENPAALGGQAYPGFLLSLCFLLQVKIFSVKFGYN